MQKIDLTELQAAADSRQLSASEQPIPRTERQEQIIETVWQTLADVYGSTLVTQYGEVMPEAWIALLKGLTPSQIKDGLNRIAVRESSFPPNGAEFRQLCLPETISPDGHNSDAYLNPSDPRHSTHESWKLSQDSKLRLEDKTYAEKRKQTGNDELKKLKEIKW
jgi:hypothetical protein